MYDKNYMSKSRAHSWFRRGCSTEENIGLAAQLHENMDIGKTMLGWMS